MKAYKLSHSNQHFCDYFQGIVVDEENSILWSEQDLSQFGFQELNQPNDFYMFCIALPFVVGFWCLTGIIAACKSFPNNRMKELAQSAERELEVAIATRFHHLP